MPIERYGKFDMPKGQINPKAELVYRRFSQNTNEWICFVCCEKQKSKQNKFVPSFFGQSTARQSAFGFISSLVYVKKFRNKIPFQNSTFLLSCFENILAKKTPRVKLRHCEEATKVWINVALALTMGSQIFQLYHHNDRMYFGIVNLTRNMQ